MWKERVQLSRWTTLYVTYWRCSEFLYFIHIKGVTYVRLVYMLRVVYILRAIVRCHISWSWPKFFLDIFVVHRRTLSLNIIRSLMVIKIKYWKMKMSMICIWYSVVHNIEIVDLLQERIHAKFFFCKCFVRLHIMQIK